MNKATPSFFITWRTIIVLIGVKFVFVLMIWWLNHTVIFQNIWSSYDIDKHELFSFCEKTDMSKPIRQPINTFSNIVYLLVAIFILKKTIIQTRNTDTSKSYKVLFGFILLYVFFMGSFYHASLINIALRLDYSGVYLISLFPLMYFSPRWSESRMASWRLKQKEFTWILFSAFLTLWLLLSIFIPSGNLTVATVVIIFVCIAVAFTIDKANHSKANLRYLILSIFSVLMAALCFELDKYKVFCDPESYIQPHALWNIFIGLASLFFYFYICSEKDKKSVAIKTS